MEHRESVKVLSCTAQILFLNIYPHVRAYHQTVSDAGSAKGRPSRLSSDGDLLNVILPPGGYPTRSCLLSDDERCWKCEGETITPVI
ncbi:hypothetical protein RclHR1_27270001 [Rhizophagus clarus]|uniref:Uncharacterized protein n=1 Tax=Rhizophagus clarus TaxID=94130 RepID=A0A2Z6R2Y2_9GLOM|nr:hypothetical protein RclHR1_27270001 [Rhizophagus clarus]GES92089.1 hypothetical protein GLOIN_2v1485672 [Rhizophagus clarus]